MATTRLVLLVEVDEDLLSGASPYTDLPDSLDHAILCSPQGSALQLKAVYLLNPKVFVHQLNALALNYHHYAVNVRGEKCREKNCELHPATNVFNLYDYTRRNETPPGVN